MRAAKRRGEVSRAEHEETALEAMDGQGELRRGLTRSVTVTEESDGARGVRKAGGDGARQHRTSESLSEG